MSDSHSHTNSLSQASTIVATSDNDDPNNGIGPAIRQLTRRSTALYQALGSNKALGLRRILSDRISYNGANMPDAHGIQYAGNQPPPMRITPRGDIMSGSYEIPGGPQQVLEICTLYTPVGNRIRKYFPAEWSKTGAPALTFEQAEIIGSSKQPVTFATIVGDFCCLCCKTAIRGDNVTQAQPCPSLCRRPIASNSGSERYHQGAHCTCVPAFAWTRPQVLGRNQLSAQPYCHEWVCCECQTTNNVRGRGQASGQQTCGDCGHGRCHVCAILASRGFGLKQEAASNSVHRTANHLRRHQSD